MSLVLGSRFGDVVGLEGMLLVDLTLDTSVDDLLVRLLLASRDAGFQLEHLSGDGVEVYPTPGYSARECTRWRAVFQSTPGGRMHVEDVERFVAGARVHLPGAEVSVVPKRTAGWAAPPH